MAPQAASAPARSQVADSVIRHVSDTALWVATFRAKEGQRADAAFDDRLASILAGERGRAIARALPRALMVEWGVIIRTSAIDRLINQALIAGVDTVLNLGAGLDTRPYRMKLPPTLRWVEVDFPHIIELKNAMLVEHQAVCMLERVGLDLLDRPSRLELLARYGTTSERSLVITEGVLAYFYVHEVAALAGDLHSTPSVRFWIQDFDNAGPRRLPQRWAAKLNAAPIVFKVKDWFGFFETYGWQSLSVITSLEESQRINRPYPLDFPFGLMLRALPKVMRQKIHGLSGAVLMQRVSDKRPRLSG